MTAASITTRRPGSPVTTGERPDARAGVGQRPNAHTCAVGDPKELGRYTLPDDTERVLVGQRIDRVVRLTDIPASGHGRRYLVERELEQDGYAALLALVADYLAYAARHGRIPAAHAPLERYLEHLS